jgi:hypothetical protein
MWRLKLFLKGLGLRIVRGEGKRIAAPELLLLHQAILRLERRLDIIEARNLHSTERHEDTPSLQSTEHHENTP